MSEYPFNEGVFQKTDDLPDHFAHEIVKVTGLIMSHAFYDVENGICRNPNVALGAIQRALGLTIAKVFSKDCREDVLKVACEALVASVKEWSENVNE